MIDIFVAFIVHGGMWNFKYTVPPMKYVSTQVPSVKSLQNCLTFSFEYRKYFYHNI